MEALLTRYRNLTVLLIAFFAQLVLIAFQVRTGKDVPLLRVWAITAVTPVEQALEFVRRNTIGVAENYFLLVGVRSENERLQKEVGQLKLKNHYLQTQLSTADRARALGVFQAQSPSKMLPARIIGTGTGTNSQVVFIDRGSGSEVEAGMAVITPDGIVGKVIDAYPTASLVMLVTDPSFAAGVISQKNHTRGTLKGQGQPQAIVDYVQNEQKVDPGEMFFTSGDDRIFPKGFPVGEAAVVKSGKIFKQIYIVPSAFQTGLEEVLVVLEGVHQPIPEMETPSAAMKMLPPPPDAAATAGQANAGISALSTDADRLKAEYKQLGETQKHVYGDGNTRAPDLTKIGQPPKPEVPAAATPAGPTATSLQPKSATNDANAGTTTPPKPNPLGAGAAATSPGQNPKPSATAAGLTPQVPKPKPVTGDATAASPGQKTKPPATDAGLTPQAPKPKPVTGDATAASPVQKPKPPATDAGLTPQALKPKPVTGDATAASPVQKPKPLATDAGLTPQAPKPKPANPDAATTLAKPKLRGPLLVTDPADANPELAAPANPPKPKQQNQ